MVLNSYEDKSYIREQMLYDLTLKAQELLASSAVTKGELARQLKTSPIQLYRLLDQTYYGSNRSRPSRFNNHQPQRGDFCEAKIMGEKTKRSQKQLRRLGGDKKILR